MKTNNNTKLIGGLEDFSGISVKNQKNYLAGKSPSHNGELAVIDFFNMKGLTDQQLETLLLEKLGLARLFDQKEKVDINSPKFINAVQGIYDQAIDIYQNDLLVDLRKPFIGLKFKSGQDIIDFCKRTYNSTAKDRRQVYCDLIKIMYWISQIESSPGLENIEEETINFVNQNFINTGKFNFDISKMLEKMNSSKKDGAYEMEGDFLVEYPGGGKKYIPIKMKFRGKKKAKIVLKALYSNKGIDSIYDLIKDAIGIEIEVEKKEDIFYILQHYYNRLNTGIYRKVINFNQKPNFLTKADIDKALEDPCLSDQFKEYLVDNGLVTKKKKTGTSKYKDIRFNAKVETVIDKGEYDTIFAELRVTLKNNKNQSGIASNEIINGMKKIYAMVGLRGRVSRNYINRVIEDTKALGVKMSDEKILEEYLNGLVQINIPGSRRVIFSTQDRIKRILIHSEEYPKIIINAIKKHFPELMKNEGIMDVIKGVKKCVENI